MTKRTILALLLSATAAACSGSGTSTTDRASDTEDDTATSGPSSSTTDDAETGGTSSTPGTGATTDDPAGTTMADSGTAADSTGDPAETDAETETTAGEDVTIVGTWLSEGKNVAPLLVELAAVDSITATFEDSPFTVLTTDTDGQEVEQTGVYIVEDTEFGELKTITLEQSTPQSITVEGIFEIDNSTSPPTMRYEVVQTIPSVGAEAPTAEGGFGSTGLGSDLTQVFVWQQG